MNVLLVGAGHAHLEALRLFAGRRRSFASVTLVTPHDHAVYSGMLPGAIAGHFGEADISIPIVGVTHAAGAQLVVGTVGALDLARRAAMLADGRSLTFDVVSLNVGSAGAPPGLMHDDSAVAVRPLDRLLAHWRATVAAVRAADVRTIAVVGGGAAGVELLCAMQYRLLRELRGDAPRFALVSDASPLLADHPRAAARHFVRILAERNVDVRLDTPVVAVDASAVVTARGERIPAERVFLATGPSAPAWLGATGLALDTGGFVAVDASLRSVSHRYAFAAGDCASIAGRLHAKAGVHAVRQGRALAENLMRLARGQPLVAFAPPRRALALITTGGRDAVASFGEWAARGRWVWQWKAAIDRRHIARYRGLAPGAVVAD